MRRSFPTRLRLETAARYVRFSLVSGGFAPPFPGCTSSDSGPRKRGLPKRRVGLGDRPQVRTGRNILAIASLKSDPGGPQRLGAWQSFTHGNDTLAAEKLQLFHKDPFDRMLIAQALMGGFAIVTSDRAFEAYPVRLIW